MFTKGDETIKEHRPEEFMIRPCHIYNEEYKECKGFKGRFHQYFIYGDYLDCSQWQTDYNNCNKWKKDEDNEAYAELIESERKRRLKRLVGHYKNDVWEKREKPPEDWDAPLPDWLVKKNANTYLDLKAKAIKDGTVNDTDMKIYSMIPRVTCSIL